MANDQSEVIEAAIESVLRDFESYVLNLAIDAKIGTSVASGKTCRARYDLVKTIMRVVEGANHAAR